MLKKILIAFILILSSQYLGAITIEDNFVKDEKGNFTKVQEYKRIVVLDPAVIETLYMIGAEDRIVAIGTTAKSKIYPEDKTKDLPRVGNIVNISRVINIPKIAPTKTSKVECTSESTLLCAVIKAIIKLRTIHIGSSVINDIAVAIENAKALWPLGIPPLRGVPSPNTAFIITVNIHTTTNTINIVYGSELFIL